MDWRGRKFISMLGFEVEGERKKKKKKLEIGKLGFEMDVGSCSGWRQWLGGQIKQLPTSGGMCVAWCVGLWD